MARKSPFFTADADLIAVTDAPGNIEQMLAAIYNKAGIYFPFVDFIVADPYKTLTNGLTNVFVTGKSAVVGNTETDIIAISDPNVHLQIWIGLKDKLPRLTGTAEKPRH